MSTAKFLLEHFYHGQRVDGGKPGSKQELLAASEGVSAELAANAVERVALPPLIRAARGAWALVRGRSRQMPFLLVQSQQGSAGQIMAHYIIAQPDVLKAFGGNLRALLAVVEDELPIYKTPALDPLPPLELAPPPPLTSDDEIDALLDLMTITGNKINIIEPLLAAVIQGVQLIVQGAPSELDERVTFIAGLLALLPPSTRFGVTFTTHSLPTTQIDTQIRFFSDDVPPADAVVFNWNDARVTGISVEDDYSRFIISQLRLDAALVTRQNNAMTSIAGWRLNEGDKLAQALGYAAKRVRIDEALRHNQPADKDEVARILEQDPTLNNELNALYARHLINFSLAMNDMSHAAPVAILLRADAELERVILAQMTEALNDGNAWLIYDTLVNWMSNPLGPTGEAWIRLTHQAALERLAEVVEDGDIDAANELLRDMQAANPGVDIRRIIPRVAEMVLPLAVNDAVLAENLFLLALQYLDDRAFIGLLEQRPFRDRLNPQVGRAWGHIIADDHEPPAGLLSQLSIAFGVDWQTAVLARFGALAVANGRVEMIDSATLNAVLRAARSPEGAAYVPVLLSMADMIDRDALAELEPPGPTHLLEIRLALRDYVRLGEALVMQFATLYPGDLQTEYLKVIETLFSESTPPTEEIPRMLEGIYEGGVRAIPHVVATAGALKGQTATPELNALAEAACQTLLETPGGLEVVQPTSVLNLLTYYARNRDVDGTIWAAHLVPKVAAHLGAGGARLLVESYRRMEWDGATRTEALNMLRSYIRSMADDRTGRATAYFERELGAGVRESLAVTRQLKRLIGRNDLVEFARHVNAAARFLSDTYGFYVVTKNPPKTAILLNMLDSLPGGLSSSERKATAQAALDLARAIVELGKGYQNAVPRGAERYITDLLVAETDPRCGLDVLRVMAGYLNDGARVRWTPPNDRPDVLLGGRSAKVMLTEITSAAEVLAMCAHIFPAHERVKLPALEIRADVASLWNEVHIDDRDVVLRMGIELQRLIDIVVQIEADADARAVENSNLGKRIDQGKHHPRNALEFYRFIYGYYVGRS